MGICVPEKMHINHVSTVLRAYGGSPCPTSSWTGRGWPHRSCFHGADVCSSLQCWAVRCHVKETVEDPDSGVEITLPPAFPAAPCSVPTTNAESQQQGKCYVIKDPLSLKELALIRTKENVAGPFTNVAGCFPSQRTAKQELPQRCF